MDNKLPKPFEPQIMSTNVNTAHFSLKFNQSFTILGDPGAHKGGEGKSKRAEKCIWNEEK